MDHASVTTAAITPRSLPECSVATSAVDAGVITWEQAVHWFQR